MSCVDLKYVDGCSGVSRGQTDQSQPRTYFVWLLYIEYKPGNDCVLCAIVIQHTQICVVYGQPFQSSEIVISMRDWLLNSPCEHQTIKKFREGFCIRVGI